jgi:hypothetical protein
MALQAQSAGIDRIFFDLEYINKRERQRGLNTVISNNNIEDIPGIKGVLTTSELLVRTNPIHIYSKDEIEKTIKYGADILMLPMAADSSDAAEFIQLIRGRAKVVIMVETAQALARLDRIIEIKGVDEIFVGLNDLHIGLGLSFMFEVLSGGIVEFIANKCHKKRIPIGFGGIARIGEGSLPAEKILAEHYRLKSNSVILSRTFKDSIKKNGKKENTLAVEVKKIRDKEKEIKNWNSVQFEENREKLVQTVERILEKSGKKC